MKDTLRTNLEDVRASVRSAAKTSLSSPAVLCAEELERVSAGDVGDLDDLLIFIPDKDESTRGGR